MPEGPSLSIWTKISKWAPWLETFFANWVSKKSENWKNLFLISDEKRTIQPSFGFPRATANGREIPSLIRKVNRLSWESHKTPVSVPFRLDRMPKHHASVWSVAWNYSLGYFALLVMPVCRFCVCNFHLQSIKVQSVIQLMSFKDKSAETFTFVLSKVILFPVYSTLRAASPFSVDFVGYQL